MVCRKCHKSFTLQDASKEQSQIDLPSGENNNNNSYHSGLRTNSEDSYDELPQSVIDDFANRFPTPPKGVWPVGETLLDGTCQVLPFSKNKLYAEGGVGVVQRIRRRDWNVDLIVKSPKPGVVLTEHGKENFERECQTWIELGLHANIVSCYFVRRIDGIPRLFAEYAPDGTLNDWISSKRLYEGSASEALARILDASIQFAWGLEHAHRQGLLHLDVKPGNVMTSGSTIKVTDFGLSKFAAESAEDSELSTENCDGMTPSYCSPEQYQAFRIYKARRAKHASETELQTRIPMTKQTDIWSWAISVLAMFHGRSPCKMGGQTAAKVFEVFLASERPTQRPAVPKGMIDLLRWCFRENPSDRPSSMQVVADQIIQIYEEVIGEKYPRRQPQNAALTAESFSNRAISLLDLGKTREALGLLDQAAADSPNQPQIIFNRALALWRAGRIHDLQAVQLLNNLTQNNSANATSFYAFGLINFERGNLKASVNAFARALEIEPKSKEVKRALEEAEKIAPFDSQCLTQYVLTKPDDNSTPPLFVDESGEFALLELIDKKIALIKVSNGQTLANFIQKNHQSASASQRRVSAVSDNYKWNLVATEPDTIVVSSATGENGSKSRVRYKFHLVDWGAKKTRPMDGVFLKALNNPDEQSISNKILFKLSPSQIEVIDLESEKVIQKITEDEQELSTFDVTPDEKWMAFGGDESLVRIWNLKNNRCVRTFYGLGGVIEALWFDPKKRVVLTLSKGNICQIWSVVLICIHSKMIHAPHMLCLINSSEELQERQAQFNHALQEAREAAAESNIPKLLQIYRDVRSIEGWELLRGQFETLLDQQVPRSALDDAVETLQLQAHEGAVSTIALSWDSSFLASAGKDRVIKLWTSAPPQENGGGQDKQPNAKSLLTRQKTWKQKLELSYHYDWIRSISLSPNNRFLASGSWDHQVALWDLSTGKRLRSLPEKIKNLTKLSFAPDGRTLAVATANGTVSLWDLGTNKPLLRLNVGLGYTRALTFNRDGRFFATSSDDSVVRFWNGRSELPFREVKGFPSKIITLDISYDGNSLVAGCENGKIYIVDLTDESGQKQTILSGHLGEVNELKLFPDGEWLASTGKDKTIRFWNLQSGKEVRKITSVEGEFCDLAIDFTGQTIYASSESGVLQSWNLLWNYNLRPRRSYDEIHPLISSITAYYAKYATLYSLPFTPENYYKINSDSLSNLSSETAPIIEEIVQKVCLEAKYRGLCDVPAEAIRQVASNELSKNNKSLWI